MEKYLAIFAAVFLAELGDKTQIATLAFAAKEDTRAWPVFAASAAALVLSSALAVLLGQGAQGWLSRLPLSLIAGVIFIVLGLASIWDHFAG